MCIARRVSMVFLAGASFAAVLPAVCAGAVPAETKTERRAEKPLRPLPERPAVMLERMKEQILSMDLSADQKRQIENLFAKAQDELAAERRQSDRKDVAKLRENAQTIVRELRQKVLGLLNEEQRQTLRLKLQAAQGTAVQGGELMADRLKNTLKSVELTDEQKQKLDTLLAETQRKARELTERTQLQMRELMQETRAKVEALLTPEQREKMNESRPLRKPDRGEGERPKPKADAPDDRL